MLGRLRNQRGLLISYTYRRWLPLILFFAVLGSAVPILRR
jgi:hypothetical protein